MAVFWVIVRLAWQKLIDFSVVLLAFEKFVKFTKLRAASSQKTATS
jgi:hypothetical protein